MTETPEKSQPVAKVRWILPILLLPMNALVFVPSVLEKHIGNTAGMSLAGFRVLLLGVGNSSMKFWDKIRQEYF